MKVAILSAILLGLVVSQTTTTFDGRTKTCTLQNEGTNCADLTDACCGTIVTRVGTATAVTTTKCISRRLSDDVKSLTYGTTTVTYNCLNTTKPANYETYTTCVNDTSCTTSGYCCATTNYTISTVVNRNLTTTQCIPGSIARDSGSVINHLFSTTATSDISTQAICYAGLNTNFYASSAATLMKGAASLLFAGLALFLLH
eukprot:403356476